MAPLGVPRRTARVSILVSPVASAALKAHGIVGVESLPAAAMFTFSGTAPFTALNGATCVAITVTSGQR